MSYRVVRIHDVLHRVGLSRSTQYRLIRRGAFPLQLLSDIRLRSCR